MQQKEGILLGCQVGESLEEVSRRQITEFGWGWVAGRGSDLLSFLTGWSVGGRTGCGGWFDSELVLYLPGGSCKEAYQGGNQWSGPRCGMVGVFKG